MAHVNIILWNNTILFYKNPAIQVGKIASLLQIKKLKLWEGQWLTYDLTAPDGYAVLSRLVMSNSLWPHGL